MKLLIVMLFSLFALIAPGGAAPEKKADPKTSAEENKPADSKSSVDAETEKEVLAMENQLRGAIEKCDEAVLREILADYYADALEGSEKAMTKAGTIASCRSGRLFFLALDEKIPLQRSAEMIIIEGIARGKQSEAKKEGGEKPEMFHVQRRWTKKNKKWILVMQQRRPVEDEREKSREQSK
jgi:hypothetical protein